MAVFHLANAPGHGTVGADGVAQQIAHHGGLPLLRQTAQLLIDGPVGVHAVIVVSVDDAERLLHIGPGAQHGVGGAEGLGTPGGHGIEGRQTGIILHGVAYLHRLPVPGRQPGNPVAAEAAHQVLHIVFDNEHDLGEARPDGVVDGVFHQNFAAGAYAVHLFISAIAGAKPGRHDNKSCLHICFPPHIPDPVFRARSDSVVHHTTFFPPLQPFYRMKPGSRLVNMGKFIKLLQFGMEICGRRIYNRRLL